MKHSASLVSIILPNYNHAAFLQERLDSIFHQSHQNFEVIILDDASTDSSASLLEPYRNHAKVSHFHINKVNTGSPFLQWKKGLLLARGKYIWIAESDDCCELDFLEKQIQQLDSCDVAVARTKVFNTLEIGREITHPAFRAAACVKLSRETLLFCPILNVSTIVFKAVDQQQLSNATFVQYPIIGDLVFYYEFFFGSMLCQQLETTSYFRQEGTGLSNLDSKGLPYLAQYFNEHMKYIKYVKQHRGDEVTPMVKPYVHKFYRRVRDRLSKQDKLSFSYLKLYLYYQYLIRTI